MKGFVSGCGGVWHCGEFVGDGGAYGGEVLFNVE
jgi:hypothetical protein